MLLKSTDSMACPLCGSTNSGTFAVTKDYNWGISGSFIYVRCTGCGLVFQDSKTAEKNLSQLYPQFYGSYVNGWSQDLEDKINNRANAIRARTLKTFLASGTLFDVGCGSGFFLEFMKRRGWNVSGLDPAKEHVAFAKEKLGLDNIEVGLWPSADSHMKKVDAVSFLHVIEHLNHPVMSLAAARDILVPGGLLLIETPNIKSWPARIFRSRWVTLDAPRHLNLFSPDNLRHALEQADFEILHLATYSPSTMEYTESIRYAMMDLKLHWDDSRNQNVENRTAVKDPDSKPAVPHFIPGLKKMAHLYERKFFYCINTLADLLGYGCNVIIVAKAA